MKHPNRARLSKLSLGLIVALAAAPVFAQSTSAGVGGQVTGANGQPVAGAEVTITHVESGTVSRATTDASGRYNARGLRVGGPYIVTVTKAGEGTKTEDNVYLGLDQVATVNAQLSSGATTTLETVIAAGVSPGNVFSSDNRGMGTSLSRDELDRNPSPDRSIQDVVRTDPNVVVTDRDRGAFSAMGQNFRYNSITVDTIQAGDPFGLNDNGLPTKGTPISQDAIQSYNISTANYDVATRRGVGAWVNAVTKSGTNDLHGSLYYVYQDADSMVGKGGTNRNALTKWSGYTRDTTMGFTLGGPIIKDKLFFFVSYEEGSKKGLNGLWGASDSSKGFKANGITQAQVDAVVAAAEAAGLRQQPESTTADMDSKRALVKLDWNINDFHRASLRWSRTKEFEPIIVQGNSSRVNLPSNWYGQDKKSTGTTLSLYDDWTENFSTELSIGYSQFDQLRGPLFGQPQPEIIVHTNGASNGPSIVLGTEYSSQANVLATKSWNAYFAGSWYLGSHVLKAGLDFQQDEFYNLFLQRYYGQYEFLSVQNFQNAVANHASGVYRYRYATPANGYNLDDNVAAQFTMKQYGFFLQDTWQATDKLSVQYGLRYDLPRINPDPTLNPCFAAAPGAGSLGSHGSCFLQNNAGNPNAAVGGFGFPNTNSIDGNGVLQPRFSFNYTFDTKHSTQLRGGAGLFISNTPAVWVANPYSNNGVAVATFDSTSNTSALPFNPDPLNQLPPGTAAIPGKGSAKMGINVVDPNFKMPTVAKFTLGLDKELPWHGLVATFEYQHLDVVKGIRYVDLNMGAPTGTLPDGRPTYNQNLSTLQGTDYWNSNTSFSNVLLLTNTDKGKSDNFTVSLRKPFNGAWSGRLAYTFSRATDVNPGTSSVAYSSYSNRTFKDIGAEEEGISNYSIPNRVIAQLSWQHNFFGDYATRVSAFYDGHDGAPYSWTFNSDIQGVGIFNPLAYVPKGPGDIVWANAASQAKADAFWGFVASNVELQGRRGQIFDRNAARAPWVNQLDLSFSQEIPGFMKGHKGEVRLDIFNFLNLLNKDWGVEYRAQFPLYRYLADVAGVCTAVSAVCTANDIGKYIYDISNAGRYGAAGTYAPTDLAPNESFNPSQRWSMRLTVRYKF
ncbi:carboxypeptidase regulatory-like domain-containing protein [Thermomonas sp.]|uniref:TonB-dependent receptor n=1 Tax=Thermomonas sp. TaxID=1971895 RepID=UPI0035B41DAB